MKQYMQLVVKNRKNLTPTIKKFTLTSEQTDLPLFGAGAHISVCLPMGERQYSLVNDPLEMNNEYEIAVKKVGDRTSGSGYLHECVKEGDRLKVSLPDNFFPVRTEAKEHVFFAAGIGITPFVSMLSYLKKLGQSFQLHYVARSEQECAFYDYLSSNYRDQVIFYFMNRNERMERLQKAILNQKVGTHLYICGPQSFMDALVDFTNQSGYPGHFIHEERFRPAVEIKNPAPFEIKLKDSENTVQVVEDQTALDALHEAGIPIPYACKMGVCGTCEVNVVEGEVIHCDTFLTREERKTKMLTCVSRGVDQLKIDP